MFVIESQSAYQFRNCLIGSGETEAAAWADAFGPKPWGPSAKKSARNAWVREVTQDEFYDLQAEAGK